MKKTSPINLMVEPQTKKNLKIKAEDMGLTLTGFFEKVAQEDIVFLDKNFKKAANLFNLSM